MAAKSSWAAFPHDAKGFAYAGDALKKAWPKLHAGDCEPFPDSKRAAALLGIAAADELHLHRLVFLRRLLQRKHAEVHQPQQEAHQHDVNEDVERTGTDAQAEVSVMLAEDGRTVRGTGTDVDTMVASARAYVNALNKLMVKRGRSALGGLEAAS